ncbi:hypothetical protein MMC17_003389 [Xylographa soralifera]|nr:hypothetical protein [Xylographa soralifera]
MIFENVSQSISAKTSNKTSDHYSDLEVENYDLKSLVQTLRESNRIKNRNFQPRRPIEAECEIQRLQREVEKLATANENLHLTIENATAVLHASSLYGSQATTILHTINVLTFDSHRGNASTPSDDLNAPVPFFRAIQEVLGPSEKPARIELVSDEHLRQTEPWNDAEGTHFTAIDQRLVGTDLDSERNEKHFNHSSFSGDRHISDVPEQLEHVSASSARESQKVLDLSRSKSPAPVPNLSVNEQPCGSHEAAFECPLCLKRFTRAFNLRSHVRTHMNERPFACTVCLKAFTRLHDLNNHKIVHTRVKNFKCAGCEKRFSRATALKRHSGSKTKRGCSANHVQSDKSDPVDAIESP